MAILGNSHVLAVRNADETAKFFIEKLGFTSQMVVPEQWHFVVRDRCRIMLGTCPNAIPPSQLGDHSYFAYFNVDNIGELYSEFRRNGADVKEPEDKPWGMREMAIRTPDGHRLTFGQEL